MMAETLVRQKSRNSREQRRSLLRWASAVSGVRLRHIAEVQNGAIFCYIVSLLCEFDLSLVNYNAQEECECLANYRLIQTVAKARALRGLNHKAKLSHWGRLADSESDAWEFLGILQRLVKRAAIPEDALDQIDADSTPPPPPLYSQKGLKTKILSFTPASHESLAIRAKAPSSGFEIPKLQPKYGAQADILDLSKGLQLLQSELSEIDCRISTGKQPQELTAFQPSRQPSMQSDREFNFGRILSGASTITPQDPESPTSLNCISSLGSI